MVTTGSFEAYQPSSADDAVARSPVGVALALAERLDTLVGCFGIGRACCGEEDCLATCWGCC